MVYICAGMPRSGSTWMFNAVRLLLKNAALPDFASGFVDDKEELLQHGTALIKLHRFRPDLAAKADVVLTSHRDLRDVAASAHRIFHTEFSTAAISGWVREQVKWAQFAAYDLHYENLLVDRLSEVKKIAASLRLPPQTLEQLPYEAILHQVEGEKFGKKVSETTPHDAVNLMHKGHITDGRHGSWKGRVPDEFVSVIERQFRGWMATKGYLSPPAELAVRYANL
jgi:hypothetical protein